MLFELQLVETMRLIVGVLHHEHRQDSLWISYIKKFKASANYRRCVNSEFLLVTEIIYSGIRRRCQSFNVRPINCSKELWGL